MRIDVLLMVGAMRREMELSAEDDIGVQVGTGGEFPLLEDEEDRSLPPK
jgi:hypothetical protein